MSLSQALGAAVDGLRASQTGLALVASNVANANTPGYTKKTLSQVAVANSGAGIGVRVTAVQRQLDQYVQRQLRTESSGAAYAALRSQFYDQIQSLFGEPGADGSLEATYNNFTSSLQALSTSPDDGASRSAVISAAQLLTQQLNSMTEQVQSLRSNAELGLADAVTQANDAMSNIAQLNSQIAAADPSDGATATLLDQRDTYIDKLSQLMDITVVQGGNSQVSIFTSGGLQLVGLKASALSFDAQGTMTATAQWSADPNRRNVGTIKLISPTGAAVDLIQTGAIRSGQIAAYLQMRDQDLVQTQNQLDAIAAGMAKALSSKTTAGSPVSAPPQAGFQVDIGSLLAGNTITIDYKDNTTNTTKRLTLMRVDDPTALPLSNTATIDPNDKVVGINFSGGITSIVAQINGALSSTGMAASTPGGTVLQILDDGAANQVDINGLSTTATVTSLTGGPELPFFDDGGIPYSGSISGFAPQSMGFAGRISVNAALISDPSKLVLYQPTTGAGDGTRPSFISNQLAGASLQFSPSSGIGTTENPFSGSLTTFLRQVISQQGTAAAAATNLKQGQDVVLNSLQQRFDDSSTVNVDEEMAKLLNLQNSYAANARVMSAVKDMFDTLLQMAS